MLDAISYSVPLNFMKLLSNNNADSIIIKKKKSYDVNGPLDLMASS